MCTRIFYCSETFILIDLNVAELFNGYLERCWTVTSYITGFYSITIVYWVTRYLLTCLHVVLNVAELRQALADLHLLFYWVTRFLLNCILVALNVAELSQVLAELCAGGFYSIWTVYWVTILTELSTGWMDSYWTVYWLYWILLNCHRLCHCM